MVLLTSSTVSVMISSGVVCIFTFLLFLSGYVLQQQSVRSIREAIRRPPEPKPVPTLPPRFWQEENDTMSVALEEPADGLESVVGGQRLIDPIQVAVVEQGQNQAVDGRPTDEQTLQRLAYILALEEPSHLCSAFLFAKQQRAASRLSVEPSIVLLYPTTWESNSSPLYTSALASMRQMQELYNLLYRPVHIRAQVSVRSQLLGELQWKRWDYDQALYLRLPGMIIDNKALDAALASPDTRGAWTPLNKSSGDDPDVLLLTSRGLQSPRGAMRKLVVSDASNGFKKDDQANSQASRRDAAYVLFGDQKSDGADDIGWYRDVRQRFDQGTKSVCEASGLMEHASV